MLTITFPRTKFVDECCLAEQVEKIKAEAREVQDAYYSEPNHRIAEEMVDTMIACATGLLILQERYGVNANAMVAAVIEKNRVRGYYDNN